jgi:hypothetical protein
LHQQVHALGNHDQGREQRQNHQPIEQQVTQDGGRRRPRIAGEQAEVRREIVAELAQVIERLGLGRERIHRLFRATAERREYILGRTGFPLLPMDPCLQPAGDITAAGDAGQIVEAWQHPRPGQGLQHAEIERCAANAAAGETQGRQRLRPVAGAVAVQVADDLEQLAQVLMVLRIGTRIVGTGRIELRRLERVRGAVLRPQGLQLAPQDLIECRAFAVPSRHGGVPRVMFVLLAVQTVSRVCFLEAARHPCQCVCIRKSASWRPVPRPPAENSEPGI